MTWLIGLMIVGVIVFFFLRDRDKMLDQKVDGQGGMKIKYGEFVDWIMSEPNTRIVKITRDHIQISNVMLTTATHFFITETFSGVEIVWDVRLGAMGNHKKTWKFASTISNEQIIKKVGDDIDEYTRKMM